MNSGVKVMFYCHDSYGLGHLSRTLTLARYLQARNPSVSQLIVTGSPIPQTFSFPEDIDYIKLPSVVKTGQERYEPRAIRIPFDRIRRIRSEILFSAARHFQPDLLVVDHAPAGLKGEVVATLDYLKVTVGHTRLVLGLRDVLDDAATVRQAWARDDVYKLLDHVYDMILVYGHQHVYDIVREYGLSPVAAQKTRYVGYLRREREVRSREQVRAELGLKTDRLVVVTAGGGGDGYDLFHAVVDALRSRPKPAQFDCLLVLGPLMPTADRERLKAMMSAEASVRSLDCAEQMADYIAAADAVVSMGGYNTVCEILSFKRAAIIVPRVAPRREQLLRAEALQRRGVVQMIHPADLSPNRLLREVEALLKQQTAARPGLPLDGLPAIAAAFDGLLDPAGAPSPWHSLAIGC